MELGPSRPPVESSLEGILPDGSWVSPIADDRVLPVEADPAELAAARDSIRLAFVAALQHLPARQRAALILCEVLRWQAAEVADLLDTSVAAVNSALQRARGTLASVDLGEPQGVVDAQQAELLAQYVDAFERYDVNRLVALLPRRRRAVHAAVRDVARGGPEHRAMDARCRQRLPGFPSAPDVGQRLSRLRAVPVDPLGGHMPWALQVLETEGGRVAGIHSFLEVERIFPAFGLPAHLPA